MTPEKTGLAYRPDIDGLRAIAVMSVVLGHARLGLSGGYIGVDVFFVISGYLITRLVLQDHAAGRWSLAHFWERRFRRILPASFVMAVATAVIAPLILLPSAFTEYARSLQWMSGFASNICFYQGSGYFETNAWEKPLLHTWSLAVEEQFYLFFPLIFTLVATTLSHSRQRSVFIFLWLLSLGVCLHQVPIDPKGAFYLLPYRGWELLTGAILAYTPAKRASGQALWELGSITGFALILVPALVYTDQTPFPGLTAMLPVLGAALIIAAGEHAPRLPWFNRALSHRFPVFIGLISYSLYLWHWPFLVFAQYANLDLLRYPYRMGLVVLSIGVAYLSWRYVEQPFRQRRSCASRRAMYLGAAAMLAITATLGFYYSHHNWALLRHDPQTQAYLLSTRYDARFMRGHTNTDIPQNLARFGPETEKVALFIFGDSQAQALMPAIEELSQTYALPTQAAWHAGSPPVKNCYAPRGWQHPQDASNYIQAVLTHLAKNPTADVLIVARWHLHHERFGDTFDLGMQEVLRELQTSQRQIYYFYTPPFYKTQHSFEQYALYDRYKKLSVSEDLYAKQRESETELFAHLRPIGAFTLLDPAPYLPRDAGGRFVPYDQGGMLYADDTHLSPYGVKKLIPLLEPLFKRLSEDRVNPSAASH